MIYSCLKTEKEVAEFPVEVNILTLTGPIGHCVSQSTVVLKPWYDLRNVIDIKWAFYLKKHFSNQKLKFNSEIVLLGHAFLTSKIGQAVLGNQVRYVIDFR